MLVAPAMVTALVPPGLCKSMPTVLPPPPVMANVPVILSPTALIDAELLAPPAVLTVMVLLAPTDLISAVLELPDCDTPMVLAELLVVLLPTWIVAELFILLLTL